MTNISHIKKQAVDRKLSVVCFLYKSICAGFQMVLKPEFSLELKGLGPFRFIENRVYIHKCNIELRKKQYPSR